MSVSPELFIWRRARRAALLEQRMATDAAQRTGWNTRITETLLDALALDSSTVVAGTTRPQAHDIPMDYVVTQQGMWRARAGGMTPVSGPLPTPWSDQGTHAQSSDSRHPP
jgi:hypothetical protein